MQDVKLYISLTVDGQKLFNIDVPVTDKIIKGLNDSKYCVVNNYEIDLRQGKIFIYDRFKHNS
jgi:hypothetical protein